MFNHPAGEAISPVELISIRGVPLRDLRILLRVGLAITRGPGRRARGLLADIGWREGVLPYLIGIRPFGRVRVPNGRIEDVVRGFVLGDVARIGACGLRKSRRWLVARRLCIVRSRFHIPPLPARRCG
jgi:hypothetical protein